VRRLFGKFTFLPVILILAGFVVFTVAIAEPVQKAERRSLVVGTVTPAGALREDGPFRPYVALHKGAPGGEIPEFPLDDQQPLADGKFELSADQGDGTRFYLLARIETATLERWCDTVALPPVRKLDDGRWVDAATGAPLPPLRISVDDSTRCS